MRTRKNVLSVCGQMPPIPLGVGSKLHVLIKSLDKNNSTSISTAEIVAFNRLNFKNPIIIV
jgi:hypothetical protein